MHPINPFPVLEKLGFFEHFSVSKSGENGISIEVKERIVAIDQPFLVASGCESRNKGDVLKIFGPGYGIFLMTVLIYEGSKRGWKRIELTPAEQDAQIITQKSLERFYQLFGFTEISKHFPTSYMLFSYTEATLLRIENSILEKLEQNKDVKEGGIKHISSTSRGVLLMRHASPFHQEA